MSRKLEAEFDSAMREIYRKAVAECDYRPTRFLQLIEELGAVPAARQLLSSERLPDGLVKLWELSRLDLSLENLVLTKPWNLLFSEGELIVARQRLLELGYTVHD